MARTLPLIGALAGRVGDAIYTRAGRAYAASAHSGGLPTINKITWAWLTTQAHRSDQAWLDLCTAIDPKRSAMAALGRLVPRVLEQYEHSLKPHPHGIYEYGDGPGLIPPDARHTSRNITVTQCKVSLNYYSPRLNWHCDTLLPGCGPRYIAWMLYAPAIAVTPRTQGPRWPYLPGVRVRAWPSSGGTHYYNLYDTRMTSHAIKVKCLALLYTAYTTELATSQTIVLGEGWSRWFD